MSDEETRVVIRADEEGFAEVAQQAEQLSEALGNKPDGAATAVGQLDERLKSLDQTLRRTGSSLNRVDKRVTALAGNMTGLVAKLASMGALLPGAGGAGGGGGSGGGGSGVPSPGGAAGPAPGAAGGGAAPATNTGRAARAKQPPPGMGNRFFQGFLQGAGGPQFLPHGQGWGGMAAQVAGNTGGQFMRGALSAPFTGMGGLSTAMGAIPGGGIVGGLLQSGIAASQSAVALQQQTLGLGSALVDPSDIAAARAAAMGQVGTNWGTENAEAFAAAAGTRAYSDAFSADVPTGDPRQRMGFGIDEALSTEHDKSGDYRATKARYAAEVEAQAAYAEGRESAMALHGDAAASRAMGLAGIDEAGLRLGAMDAGQARSFAGAVAGRAGGGIGALQQNGGYDAALAAQTVYGVSPEASGGVLAGQRYGGLQGAGNGGAGLAGVLAQALASGVDRSHMAEAIQDIASQQSQYAQTGLSADTSSFFGGVGALNRLGISDPRARGITGNMRERARGIATGGVSNSNDYAMLTTLGGYRPGGSEDELGSALERLESGGDLSKIPDLVRMANDASGGGLAGRIAGANIGGVPLSEARRIISGEVDPAAVAAQQAASKSGLSLSDLTGKAQGQIDTYGSGARTSAAVSNERAAAGANFIETAANLERTALASVRGLGAFEKQINTVTTTLLDVGRGLEMLMRWLGGEVSRPR